MSRFTTLFSSNRPVIGVIHLPPLPGFAGSPGLAGVVEKALTDLGALESGGVDGVLVENEHDRPHEVEAGRATIAAMTRVTREVVSAADRVVVGVEILLNDPQASLAVAMAAGSRFVRTDYFVDRMTRPEYGGEMRIDPSGVMAFRKRIGAAHVLVLADIQVKFARMLEPRPLEASAMDASRHDADAIVVTGGATGAPPLEADLVAARRGAGRLPVLIGSGLDATNARELLRLADGAIVGTSLKTGADVDRARVADLMAVVRSLEPARP
jgi:membrane complex biogenesis BtpA family protein